MRVFLRTTLLFLACAGASVTVLQAIVSARMRGRSLTGHDNLEQTASVHADLLFMGSSRCLVHYDPRFFDSAFGLKSVNLGMDGHSQISMAVIRLRDYLSRNRAPRWVVLNVDPFIGMGSIHENDNFVHKDVFARYAFLPARKDLPIVDYFGFDWRERYLPMYAAFKYGLLDDVLRANEPSSWSRYGYEVHPEDWDTVVNPVSDVMTRFFFHDTDTAGITRSLRDFDTLCRTHGIRLICIQTPDYRVLHDDRRFSATGEICQRAGVPFIDANHPHIRHEIGYFYNSNHMNQRGVAELNRILVADSTLRNFLTGE